MTQGESDIANLSFTISVPAETDTAALRDLADNWVPSYKASPGVGSWTFQLPPNADRDVRDMAVRASLETIWNRVDQFGVAEPVIQRQGLESDRILVQLPGVDAPGRVNDLI